VVTVGIRARGCPAERSTAATFLEGNLLSALAGLRLIVEQHTNLSRSARTSIAVLVRQRLRGRQYSVVVRTAIDLAAALRDPETTAMVSAIASAADPAAVGLSLLDQVAPFENLRAAAAGAAPRRPDSGGSPR